MQIVAAVLKLGDCLQPLRGTRMPGHKNQITLGRSGWMQPQKCSRNYRNALVVHTE